MRHMTDAPDPDAVYKIVSVAAWDATMQGGIVAYSDVDRRDGYMHLSTGAQVLETARLHFAGQTALVALEIDPARFGEKLKFEPSRGGELFPHLYGELSARDVTRVFDLVPAPGGGFRFGAARR